MISIPTILNSVYAFVLITIVYFIACLLDIYITGVPIITPIIEAYSVNTVTNKLTPMSLTEISTISMEDDIIIVYDIQRLRSADLRSDRKLEDEKDNSVVSLSVVNKTVKIEHIKIKLPIQIPTYLKVGCKKYYTDTYYQYTYNILTDFNPITVRLPEFKFCFSK